MAARVGSWLEGPGGGGPSGDGEAGPPSQVAALGLPRAGPGSVALQGRRVGGFVVDLVAALLLGTALRLAGFGSGAVGLAQTGFLLAEVFALQALLGRSLGQLAVGTRLISIHGGGRPRWWWVALRVLLLALPVPGLTAFVNDEEGRGLHDRAAGTVVVLT